jgi:hypothetical protein
MMDGTLQQHVDPWRAGLERTMQTCARFYARRVPYWIATGTQIWSAQMESRPLLGQSLPDEFMRTAKREIELRGDFTQKVIGEFAESSPDVPVAQILVDCTTIASELIRRGCDDVARDIETTAKFLLGIDAQCAQKAMAQALTSVTDRLLDVVKARPDYALGAPITLPESPLADAAAQEA